MSVSLPSDDVAEDFKSSLEDLVDSAKPPITNLTIIAKENIEHASAISRVLENHIKTTPPNRKLPALYLLDSIVKNIGTPYTLFLSRNLYSTFMTAYSLVNGHTRQKLDEMLSTWKLPNAGSLETKPVFPQNVTKPIEDALSRAKSAAQEQNSRQASMMMPDHVARNFHTPPYSAGFGSTMVPPNARNTLGGSSLPSYANPSGPLASTYTYPGNPVHQSSNFATMSMPPMHQQQSPYHISQPPIDLPQLHRDIADLVRAAQSEVLTQPSNNELRGRLQALITLQNLLQQQYHPPQQLQLVRDQVTDLQTKFRPPPPAPVPGLFRPESAPAAADTPGLPPVTQAYQKPEIVSSLDLKALMSSRNLATIIASAQRNPSVPAASAGINLGPHSNAANGATDLMASLTRAGLLHESGIPPTQVGNNGAQIFSHGTLANLVPLLDLELTSSSLKSPRLNLVSLLYESQPNQCTTCGRRFTSSEEGKSNKSKHYDWHFRINQRVGANSKRVSNRSWYVDELEWIKSPDDPEGNLSASIVDSQDLAGTLERTKTPFVPVPADQDLANQPCPICQERFTPSFNQDVSDWVWMDAVQIYDSRTNTVRIYHASCHRELKRPQSRDHTPARTETPDSVLGKRKTTERTTDVQTKMIKV